MGHVPRVSLGGRNRYQARGRCARAARREPLPCSAERRRASAMQVPTAADDFSWTLGPRQMSPEAREAARRTFLASLRSLVYGSVIAAVGLAAGGTLAASALDIRSGEAWTDGWLGARGLLLDRADALLPPQVTPAPAAAGTA